MLQLCVYVCAAIDNCNNHQHGLKSTYHKRDLLNLLCQTSLFFGRFTKVLDGSNVNQIFVER